MTRHGGDEDARAEYDQDERDLRDAGYRRLRDPRGGWTWVRRCPTPEDHPWV